MDNHSLLFNSLVYLSAAVISVPIAKKLGLGSVLGYLLAGVIIGPFGWRLINNSEDIMHFAEFGVVLLLFLIGLELNPTRLWNLRKPIIGTGGLQVALTAIIIFSVGIAFQLDWETAFVTSVALALSSTAIVLQILTEKNLLTTQAGSSGFSILLFQDIAVIPVLAILPLLAVGMAHQSESDPLLTSLKVIGVILIIVLGGRYLTRPILRVIASTHSREIFTAFSLMIVIGVALLMQAVDMSMALGSFLGGVLLADSEYRHQLETDIEPFKGLLLGLFFMSVGMSIDFGLLLNEPLLIAGIVVGLVLIKILVLFFIARITGIPNSQHFLFAFLLSQGGEFAFVIFSVALSYSIISPEINGLLTVSVALSMVTTPLLLIVESKFIAPRFANLQQKPEEDIIDETNPVIIAGFGRFGQIVARLLYASKIPVTIIDQSPEHIERVRRFGFKVFYGNASRMDLLESAGIANARLLVLAIDDHEATVRIAQEVKLHHPKVRILARAWDMIHAYQLMDVNVEVIQRETLESALMLGEKALIQMGMGNYRARRLANQFRIHDEEAVREIYKVHQDEQQLITRSQEAREDLEKLFEADEVEISKDGQEGWN